MKNFKKCNGITLVSLVVTIVILLILSGVTINAKELVYSDGTHYVSIDAKKIYTYNSYVQILSGVTDSYGDVVSVPYGRGYFKTLRIDRLNSTLANADKDGCIYVENGFLRVKIS